MVPSLLAGVGLALSLPPWGFWALAGPAAGLLWWRLGGLRFRQRLLAGWMAGLGLFGIGLFWVTSFNVYGGVVLIVLEALVLALAAAVSPPGRGRMAALAGAMVLGEALRSAWPFGGLPLGGIALGQAGGPLAGAARIGGPLLLVGLVWLAGSGLGALATALADALGHRRALAPRPPGLGRGRDEGSDAAARAGRSAGRRGHALWSWWPRSGSGARSAPTAGPGVASVRVAAVQGGGARGLRKSEVSPASVFAAQRAATAEIPSLEDGRPPALVVWPEDVVSLDVPLGQSTAQTTLAAIARLAARHPHRGGDRDRLLDGLPQRDRGLRPRRPAGGPLREGPPGPLR